ncbi:MAG: lytic murein transglycosylase [Thermoleophilaceae bacterium]
MIAAALLGAALAVLTLPASAEKRTVTVVINGQPVTLTVDVPPGTPIEDIEIPLLPPPAQPTPTQPQPTPTQPEPSPQPPSSGEEPDARGGEKQRKTGDERDAEEEAAEPRADVEAKKKERAERRQRSRLRNEDGSPTRRNPGFFEALPGPSTVTGVPNFVIRKFRVPLFLLPIYQAAGIQYGVRWEHLAAINEIETDYGRNLNVSSAGAVGWMQFLPSTWRAYGVDANKDGEKDPYNPVDAIFAAARYLKAAGYEKDADRALFAYNHADWYVDSVNLRAKLIAGVPGDVVGSLTGLTEGRFPVFAKARYADDLSEREASRRVRRGENAANVVEGSEGRRGIEIYTRRGAPIVAVNDGVVKEIGENERLGRYIVLQDVYGNRFTYAGLSKVASSYPVPKEDGDDRTEAAARKANAHDEPDDDPRPEKPASAGSQDDDTGGSPRRARESEESQGKVAIKERLFANPARPQAQRNGGAEQMLNARGNLTTFRAYFSRPFGLDPRDVELKQLKEGSRVIGGTILGRTGKPEADKAPHMYFEIRPAGRGAPRIDPKPILDGWKLLEATAIYRSSGRNVLYGDDEDDFSIGQVMLLPKHLLEKRVLSDSRIEVYDGGRTDIRSGQIDRRVLATLAFLAESGLRPTVTSLKSGHSVYTASGNVSHHSSGNAVDIARINGVPILGHQEPGGVTEQAVRRILQLQGTLAPDQIISLLEMGGPTFAMADHADHIHVGFRPLFGNNERLGRQTLAVLKPDQWSDLIERLGEIDNPVVRTKPSDAAIPVKKKKRASDAHSGE